MGHVAMMSCVTMSVLRHPIVFGVHPSDGCQSDADKSIITMFGLRGEGVLTSWSSRGSLPLGVNTTTLDPL